MDDRFRRVVLAVILSVWVVVVAFYLIRHELPDAKVLGIPIGALIALRPGKKKDDDEDGGDE